MNDIFLYVFDRLKKDKYPTDKTSTNVNSSDTYALKWNQMLVGSAEDDLIHEYTVYLVLFSFGA